MAERLRVGRITGLEGVPEDTDNDGNPVDQYGLWINDGGIVVVNDAGTVILDGTSNMFKILASGTLDGTAADPGSPPSAYTTQIEQTTLTGLGSFDETPGHLSFVGDDFNVSDAREIGRKALFTAVDEHDIIGLKAMAFTLTQLDGSMQCQVVLQIRNFIGGSTHRATVRYYVLQEAAI